MLGFAVPVLLGLSAVHAQNTPCCQAVGAAGIENVLLPSEEAYEDRTDSYWSVSAQLTPYCIIQPTSVDEVTTVLKTLNGDAACSSTKFAVRSGGHTTWAGSNNIEDGVTVDMGLMDKVTFSNSSTFTNASSIAQIGAGARWGGVYGALTPLGYTVPGGRASTVGVAGFLTGGGNSFYTARMGFACDNVENFEVVLASGEVVNANADDNADLWKALKGGSGANFGIVTRFDMMAFEAGNLWGGTATYNKSVTAQQIDAYVNWTDNVANYPAGSSIVFWSYLPAMKDVVILAAYEDTEGNEAPAGFDEFMAIPRIADTLRVDSHKALTDELEQEPGYRDIWFTMAFSNNKEIFTKIVDFHQEFVDEWSSMTNDTDFITQCMFQSIPTIFSERSADKGGNMMGLDQVDENIIMLLFNIAVKTEDEEARARPLLRKYTEEMKTFASSKNGLADWIYLNYADSYQDPLGSYGAENVEFIRTTASKYDPEGIFQTKAPGGFKISRVNSTASQDLNYDIDASLKIDVNASP